MDVYKTKLQLQNHNSSHTCCARSHDGNEERVENSVFKLTFGRSSAEIHCSYASEMKRATMTGTVKQGSRD